MVFLAVFLGLCCAACAGLLLWDCKPDPHDPDTLPAFQSDSSTRDVQAEVRTPTPAPNTSSPPPAAAA